MTITPPIVLPTKAELMLAELVDCVCSQLATNGAGPTCWCGLYAGQNVAWDYCSDCGNDQCGMGWIRVVNVYPYEIFPQQVVEARCVRPLAWAVEVGALRCLPIPHDGGPLPVPTMADVALAQYRDIEALHAAIQCCELPLHALGPYQPVGPEGGCVGGFWLAYIDPEG